MVRKNIKLPDYSKYNENGKQSISEFTYRMLEIKLKTKKELLEIIRKYNLDNDLKTQYNPKVYGYYYDYDFYNLTTLLMTETIIKKLKDIEELRDERINTKYEIRIF